MRATFKLWVTLAGCLAFLPYGHPAHAGEPHHEGRRLFEEETFGGNGRTCATCHLSHSGTLSPEDAQIIYALNPEDRRRRLATFG